MSLFKTALLTSVTLAGVAFSAPNFADLNHCPAGYAHCAYVSGLSTNPADGRFVKFVVDDAYEDISCMDNSGVPVVLFPDTPVPTGVHTVKFFICNDGNDNDCTKVAMNQITITKNGKTITVTPKEFDVDLSVLKHQFKKCDASAQWLKRLSSGKRNP